MSLAHTLLLDYGNIPASVGTYLLKNNMASLTEIENGTGLSNSETTDGLAVLIQRRFVKFFIFEKVCKYTIDRQMIIRRAYFPVYLNYVSNNYSSKHLALFSKILAKGTFKDTDESIITEELINIGLLRIESLTSKDIKKVNGIEHGTEYSDGITKHFKVSERYLIINFDYLDQKIYEEETIKLVKKKYNEAAASVLRSLLKCDTIDKNSIIKNLESTKILISDNGSLINEKENITEYLKYLVASKIIHRGFDEGRAFFFNNTRTVLKTYKISVLLKSTEMRRVFRMICEKQEIEDKNITINSLLGVNKVKIALLSLQKLGLVSQKCLGDYSSGSKMEYAWFVDVNTASLSMIKLLEQQMKHKIVNINGNWDANYFFGTDTGNIDVWTSDLISLATDHLILSIDLF